jgi:hypothetical protein
MNQGGKIAFKLNRRRNMARFARPTLITAVLVILALHSIGNEARDHWEINNMIRSDKLDFVLPKAMRNHNIDMWLIIDKGRGTEPLFCDFGDATSNGNGIFIFTDRGGDRIE